MDRSTIALLRLHLTNGLGRVALLKLHHHFGSFVAASTASATAWQEAGVSPRLHGGIPPEHDHVLQDTLRILEKLEIRLLSFWDADYPPLLREIYDPPALLYLRGTLPQQDCFAIVGSRQASDPGTRFTRDLAEQLAQRDICIVSGLARGIDAAAHRGALAAQGSTIAVLGCGIDRAYPRENADLFAEIINANAVISEYPPGTPPLAGYFPGRNRIISGLSRGVLIVEATEKSGSLITGEFALEQGRELFAAPGAVYRANSRGVNRLLKEGAQLVTEAEDILQLLWPGQPTRKQRDGAASFAASLPETTRAVFQKLGDEPLHSDEIARKCGLTPMELSAILLDLELQGGVQALPGNHYIRNRL
ncbi:DNA-processing protein DprA [Pelobacter seleniigenes]|uniref:DNA-processing protein DprA n=1 Tax=Pelobacter seleniigenes TaxID=407188 RepID=UPI0004A73519|nr:DNA-processing protein DprA [Pelobacter seleniigenes]